MLIFDTFRAYSLTENYVRMRETTKYFTPWWIIPWLIFSQIWSCFSGEHTFSLSNICLQNAPKLQKSGNVFNKVNFMTFCCHGNAINLKYYVFWVVWYTSLCSQMQFSQLNLKFLLNFGPITALNAPSPFYLVHVFNTHQW